MTATPSLDCFVDPLVGIVVETAELLDHRASPRLHSAHVVVADPSLTAGTEVDFGGGGTGIDPRQARDAAIGEAVERYSASYVDERRIVRRSQSALDREGVAHVELDRLRLFTDHQLDEWRANRTGYDRADPDTELGWVEGWSLTERHPVLVPAQFVFLSPVCDGGEPYLCPQVSTGLALGSTTAGAALGGLLECIERDAFMLTWELELFPSRIEITVDDALTPALHRYAAHSDVSWQALRLDTDHPVPVVMACCHVPGRDGVGLAVGAAAALDPAHAVEKAVREALQTLQWARLLRGTGDPPPDADQVVSFEHHVRYWADPARAGDAPFLTDPGSTITVGDLDSHGHDACADDADDETRLRWLVDELSDRGVEVVAVDVTAPDVHAAGFRAVRVLAPDLCLLDVEFGARFHGRPRMVRAAQRLDRRHLNPLPHPFP